MNNIDYFQADLEKPPELCYFQYGIHYPFGIFDTLPDHYL